MPDKIIREHPPERLSKSKDASLSKLCYSKPFLTRAILRVDFASFVEALGAKTLAPAVLRAALQHFPIPEAPKKGITQQIKISGKEVLRGETQQQNTWKFDGRDREKALSISPKFIFVQRFKYTTYEEIKTEFFDALTAFV